MPGGLIRAFVPLRMGADVFCLFILVSYILNRIVNYIIGLPLKPVESK